MKTDDFSRSADLKASRRHHLQLRNEAVWQQLPGQAESQFDKLARAITKYGGLKPMALQRHLSTLRPWRSHHLGYMNPFARVSWCRLMLAALQQHDFREQRLWMTTVIHSGWEFCSDYWDFDPDKMAEHVCDAFHGLNFLFIPELAVFRNINLDGGKLIAPHIQGFCWGNIPRTRMEKAARSFDGGMNGTLPIVRKAVTFLPGAVAYSFKNPSYGYSRIRRANQTFGSRKWDMLLPQHYLLWYHLRRHRFSSLTFGGGEGCDILDALGDGVMHQRNTGWFDIMAAPAPPRRGGRVGAIG